jgi:hypothetical protein
MPNSFLRSVLFPIASTYHGNSSDAVLFAGNPRTAVSVGFVK